MEIILYRFRAGYIGGPVAKISGRVRGVASIYLRLCFWNQDRVVAELFFELLGEASTVVITNLLAIFSLRCIHRAVSGEMLSAIYRFFRTRLFFFQNLFLPFLTAPLDLSISYR